MGVSRRSFLGAVGLAAVAGQEALARATQNEPRGGGEGRPPVAISSGNGLRATTRTVGLIRRGADPLEAAVEGVEINENDPEDMTVGYGGLPNEEGVVQLDASVMHGPSHRAGAVACLERIKNPAAVALEVARRTDHVMLVGPGALAFALKMGFKEENLLTPEAREMWLRWKAGLSDQDDWLSPDEYDLPGGNAGDAERRTGTIHLSAVTAEGDLAGVTSTSGLSWKIPGRVGDSPIIGAGLYTDNAVGSAGATGRGEAVIQVCGAHSVVQRMEAGDTPTEACLNVLKKIADKTKAPRLLDDRGRPNFNVVLYALRKDGAYGSACMLPGRTFAVSDAAGDRLEECAVLFDD